MWMDCEPLEIMVEAQFIHSKKVNCSHALVGFDWKCGWVGDVETCLATIS